MKFRVTGERPKSHRLIVISIVSHRGCISKFLFFFNNWRYGSGQNELVYREIAIMKFFESTGRTGRLDRLITALAGAEPKLGASW
jgi:hypothetical protein